MTRSFSVGVVATRKTRSTAITTAGATTATRGTLTLRTETRPTVTIPAQNEVWFNDVAAIVTAAAPDFIQATVPIGTTTGTVRVDVGGQMSNTLPFTVLVPNTSPADDVVTNVGTGSAPRSVTISPDGVRAYAVSPEADLVIPIDLTTFNSLPGIPVGDQPWALSVNPAGTYGYVANRQSGDVSIIDLQESSGSFHNVVATLNVGSEPTDILVTPSGDQVIVANSGSNDLSIIDSDELSASFHNVVINRNAGSSARSVTITPDGGRLYVGTDEGYIVFGTVDFGVVRTVPTGSAIRSATISPDGTLLVLLDTQGGISVYDIVQGSDNEDQVVASVRGSGARSATISPDGALLAVVLEEGDNVEIYSLNVGTGVSVIAPDAVLPPNELELITTLSAGENPQFAEFDPVGSGQFLVTNAGDNSVTVFGEPIETDGLLAGHVLADCPEPETGLHGVPVDVYDYVSGDLVVSLNTDQQGYYFANLMAGEYTVTVMTPLGYAIASEESLLTVAGGQTSTLDWPLACEEIVPNQRPMSYWKRQIVVALRGWGRSQIDGPTLCEYLDEIDAHFNNNTINQVVVYEPPESGECQDKLQVAKDIMSPGFFSGFRARAKQQLLALLFNVASGSLSQTEVISEDGVTVSQAITYCDNLIDDPDGDHWLATRIGLRINWSWMVPAGWIPPDTDEIAYRQNPDGLPQVFSLSQNYPNPFNPISTIKFEIPRAEHVRLKVFDLAGRLVRTLVDEPRKPAFYKVVWDGRNDRGTPVASGTYFYRLEAGSYMQTHKMMLLK